MFPQFASGRLAFILLRRAMRGSKVIDGGRVLAARPSRGKRATARAMCSLLALGMCSCSMRNAEDYIDSHTSDPNVSYWIEVDQAAIVQDIRVQPSNAYVYSGYDFSSPISRFRTETLAGMYPGLHVGIGIADNDNAVVNMEGDTGAYISDYGASRFIKVAEGLSSAKRPIVLLHVGPYDYAWNVASIDGILDQRIVALLGEVLPTMDPNERCPATYGAGAVAIFYAGTAANYCNDLFNVISGFGHTSLVLSKIHYVVEHALCHELAHVFGAVDRDDIPHRDAENPCVMNLAVAIGGAARPHIHDKMTDADRQWVDTFFEKNVFATLWNANHRHGLLCDYGQLVANYYEWNPN